MVLHGEFFRVIFIIWWFIWYNRNGVIFRQDTCSPSKVSSIIRVYVDKVRRLGALVDDYDTHFSLRWPQNLVINPHKART